MGGQSGGMVNESGHFPEVCKKSLQAQVADMQGAVPVEFFEQNDLQSLLKLTPKQAEDAGRLSFPLILKDGSRHLQPIDWDSALAIAGDALKTCTPDRAAFYSSGRSSNEAAFILQSFARVYGCNNVNNCSYYCHQASGVGLKMTFGSGTATIQLDDLAKADLAFVIGANPASNHPRLMTQLASLRERGGQVVVINPIVESGLEKFYIPSRVKSLLFGTEIASKYVQPLAGGDLYLFVGMLKALIESKNVNMDFLKENTIGYEAVLENAIQSGWPQLVSGSGVPEEEIRSCAQILASSRSAIFCWAMGLTHQTTGVENILALNNLALATGNVGRPGAGMLPIRGHSNVQGIGSIGFTPSLKDGVRKALERAYNKSFPAEPGYDTHATIAAADAGRIDTLFVLGGNLWGSNPDLSWAARGMQKVDTTVFLSTKLNPGHFQGRGKTTLILPVLARDEEPQYTTQESMFNFVRLSDGGKPNLTGSMRAESDVICDIASHVLGDSPFDWKSLKDHKKVREFIADTIPGWHEIGKIDDTKKEFTIAGRIFHTPSFPTESGKAEMHASPLPPVNNEQLKLLSLRSEGQFNTVVYEEYDLYRGIPHRHCILISPEDAEKIGVKDGQRVTVAGEAGELENIEVVVGRIRQGVAAMFYPESNAIIKANLDPRSKTPAFKNAPVQIKV